MRILALRAIRAYQRYISPHKGFCCAYRSITGRLSCSEFSARAVEKKGAVAGIRLAFRRMRRCSFVFYDHARPAARPITLIGERLNNQSGHCDLPIGDCHGSDASILSDCASNCLPSPCDIWTPKRMKKKASVEFSEHLQP